VASEGDAIDGPASVHGVDRRSPGVNDAAKFREEGIATAGRIE
jgi:hypothetical protein